MSGAVQVLLDRLAHGEVRRGPGGVTYDRCTSLIGDGQPCDCGLDQARAELARLRAEIERLSRVLETIAGGSPDEGTREFADRALAAKPEDS